MILVPLTAAELDAALEDAYQDWSATHRISDKERMDAIVSEQFKREAVQWNEDNMPAIEAKAEDWRQVDHEITMSRLNRHFVEEGTGL